MREIIFDLQGFQTIGGNFVLKELAAATPQSSDEGHPFAIVAVFKPPFAWEDLPDKCIQTNSWLIANYHGIPWDSGYIPYEHITQSFEEILGDDMTRLYVRGEEKKKWLEELIGDHRSIKNLEEFGCPPFYELEPVPMFNHNHVHQEMSIHQCAYDNVGRLKLWFERYWGELFNKGLDAYLEAPTLRDMRPEDLALLPASFLFSSTNNIYIEDVWDSLPDHLKKDPRIARCRRCQLHYNTSQNLDHFDGPIPMIKDCLICEFFSEKSN